MRSKSKSSKSLRDAERLIADVFDVHRVPVQVVAVVLGISVRQVQNLVQSQILPAPVREGREALYDLPGCVAGFVEYVASEKDASAGDSKARWWMARADREELVVEQTAARLFPDVTIEAVVAEVFAVLATQTDAIAGRTAQEFAGLADAAVIRRRQLSELREARERAAQILAAALERLRAGADPRAGDSESDAAPEPDGGGVGGDESDPSSVGGDPGAV